MTSNLGSTRIDEVTTGSPDIAQAALLETIHPELVARFQPALLARFQTLVYRPLDVAALAAIVRLKLAKVAERLLRQHNVELICHDSLIDAMAGLCLARESGARNVDAFLNQRILPAVSRELLTRMASGIAPAKILMSSSPESNLTIDFIDHGDTSAEVPVPDLSVN